MVKENDLQIQADEIARYVFANPVHGSHPADRIWWMANGNDALYKLAEKVYQSLMDDDDNDAGKDTAMIAQ